MILNFKIKFENIFKKENRYLMKIVLPDKSAVYLDCNSFKFFKYPIKEQKNDYSDKFDVKKLIQNIEYPDKKFGDCFRRVNSTPRYSTKKTIHNIHFMFLDELFELELIVGYGSVFSNAYKETRILDGKLITFQGYGFGNRSWNALEGYEVLRVVCLLFGVKQPNKLKGEKLRRPLSELLVDLSELKINWNAFRRLNCPWSLE